MAFVIPQNHKFGCIALRTAGVDRQLKDSLEVSPGLWAVFGPPFGLDSVWKEWLGSIRSELVSECNLALLTVAPSMTLEYSMARTKRWSVERCVSFMRSFWRRFFITTRPW